MSDGPLFSIVHRAIRAGERFPEVVSFIKSHGDRRIRKASRDYYESANTDGHLWFAYDGDKLIGLTGYGLLDFGFAPDYQGQDTVASIVVVHKDYRRRSIGSMLLKSKMLSSSRLTCSVATDNVPSNGMCRKAGLVPVTTVTQTRRDGQYQAVLYRKG